MVNFAVIGIGRMGGVHAENLARGRVKGARLVAVCDLDGDKLAAFGSRHFKIPCYADYDEMAQKEKIHGVVIATEHYAHADIAAYFLERGIHVLVEKPVTVSVTEAARLNALASSRPETLFAVMYNQRTNPLYHKAKELIEQGGIGNIRRVNMIITDWYRSQAYYNQGGWRASWAGEGGGTLINQCVHQLDILQWLAGMPKTVSASCNRVNRNITTENEVLAVMEFDGFEGAFQASAHELKGTNRLEIAGTKGKIIIERYKMQYLLFEKSEEEVNLSTVKGYGSVKAKRRIKRYGLKLIPDLLYGQQRNILINFCKAVEGGGKDMLIARGEEGINALNMVNGMYMSSWTQSKVSLPVDGDAYDRMLLDRINLELKDKKV